MKYIIHKNIIKLKVLNIDWLTSISRILDRDRFEVLTRFLPLVDFRSIPHTGLIKQQFREFIFLYTFDILSLAHDHAQRTNYVATMFVRNGVEDTFAGYVELGDGLRGAAVRGNKR